MIRLTIHAALFVGALALAVMHGEVLAQATGGASTTETTPPGSGRPVEQAAVDACKGKKEGDRVRFIDAKGKKRYWPCATVDGLMAARSGVATAARAPKPK